MQKWLLLMAGGVCGTAGRYALAGAVYNWLGASFPYGTLAVNGLGCFIIGLLSALDSGRFFLDDNMKMLLAVGFCGAFTTFSTFILETAHLAKGEGVWHALANVALSLCLGVLFFVAGRRLGRLF